MRCSVGLDLHVGGRERRVGVAALVSVGSDEEVLPLERLVEVDDEAERLVRGRERRERRAPRRRRCRRRRRRPRLRRSPGRRSASASSSPGPSPGPSTQRTPGTAARGLEVERRHLGVRVRAAQHGGLEHARKADVDVKRAVPDMRARAVIRGVGSPIGWVALAVLELGGVVVLDERPALLGAALDDRLGLDELAVIRPPPRLRPPARFPRRRRSGTGFRSSPFGSRRGSAWAFARAARPPT